MKKQNKIKAEIWKINICGSAVDMVHNNYQTIHELYIPSYNISCNLADGYLHCFKSDLHRYKDIEIKSKKVKSVNIPTEFVEYLVNYLVMNAKIKEDLSGILK